MSRPAAGAAALLLTLGFFVLQVPHLFDLTRYHGDERFYTDAAIGMMQSGDYLTPRYPNGNLRFEKPLGSYLVLVGSYAVFGIGVFASRLPFLLAGAGLVFATWRAGLRLLRDADAALLAAAMVAACPDFLTLSPRSTPDIFVCLFLLLAFDGYVDLLRGAAAPRSAAARAWLGAGLAVAMKGGLGGVLMGYAVAFALATKDRVAALRRLLHPVLTPLLGVALAAAGFGVYALLHGMRSLDIAVSDQVGGRVFTLAEIGRNFFAYLVIPFEHLAPWVLLVALAAVRDPSGVRDALRREPVLVRFVLGWLVLLLAIFTMADVVRGRYLAPAYAPLALVLAGALAPVLRGSCAPRRVRGLCVAVLALVALGGLVLVAGGVRFGPRLLLAGGATTAVAVAGGVATLRGAGIVGPLALAGSLLVAQTVGIDGVRDTFSRTPVAALAARLDVPELAGRRVAQIGESAHLASKLRMATGGRLRIDGFQRGVSEPDWGAYDAVVSDAPLPGSLAALGFRVEPCGESWGDDWSLPEVLELVRATDPAAVLAKRAQPFYLALRERRVGG